MKKILSILLALTIFLILSACDNDKHTLSELETGSATTSNVDSADTSIEANSSNESVQTSNVDSTDTSTKANTSNQSAETHKSQHTHNYSVAATCTEPKKCSCGATEGTALGHEYKNFVCVRCNDEQQNAFVDLKKYYWKLGEESVNLNVPGKEGMAPYSLELLLFNFGHGFLNDSSCIAWIEYPALYNSPNTDVKARTYNNKVYSVAEETNYYYTYQESTTAVTITFKDQYAGQTITFEKTGTNQLVVAANNCSFLGDVSKGAVFEAYPDWEIFN